MKSTLPQFPSGMKGSASNQERGEKMIRAGWITKTGMALVEGARPGRLSAVVESVWMDGQKEEIVIVSSRICPEELARLVERFEDMVKYVVDVKRGIAAVGGELHADAEAVLLEEGSRQSDLWGANYYPGRGEEECIEYTSLINIRPSQGNRSMVVEDPDTRKLVRELTLLLIGRGEAL